ncbi:hypothetical protein CARUB_v10021250mg [Capsella rubella]|uniref:Transmembrane protein n=1 Tax=Capsella rubella TaxID=81985 RepID=R0GJQ1_9BRAS|nr:hypothetical protein CARUB_v10021250mg [Capsella rubella]
MSSSSKLLVMMLFSFLAFFVSSHARVIFSDTPFIPYYSPMYAPVPEDCFKPPYHCRSRREFESGHLDLYQGN